MIAPRYPLTWRGIAARAYVVGITGFVWGAIVIGLYIIATSGRG